MKFVRFANGFKIHKIGTVPLLKSFARKIYGQQADPILNQKRERVIGDITGSSHIKYLENWDPGELLDELVYNKEGLFHDLEDALVDRVPSSVAIFDLVNGIIAKDYQTAIMGGAVYANPELWYQSRINLEAAFPLQQSSLIELFNAYKVY